QLKNQTVQGETFTHVCEYILARLAKPMLDAQLGEAKTVEIKTTDKSGTTTQQKTRKHNITVDEAHNKLIISGTPDKLAQARNLRKEIDKIKPGQPGKIPVGPPLMQYYTVPAGTAEALAKQLSEEHKDAQLLRVNALPNSNTLMVYGYPGDHFIIAPR